MRVGLAGAVHVHAPGFADLLSKRGQLSGVWEPDPQIREPMVERFRTDATSSLTQLLDRSDAIVVCTDNASHAAVTMEAAQAGRHVLCEKPLALSVAEGRAMIQAADRAGVVLGTALPCRFHPAYVSVENTVRSGAIGDVVAVSATNHGTFPGGWFDDPDRAGGGAIMDHTVHVADMLLHLTRSDVEEVYAVADRRIVPGIRSDDCAHISVRFANGVIASIDPSWSRPASFPTWGDVWMEVVGTHGTLTMDMFGQHLDLYGSVYRHEYWGSSMEVAMVDSFIAACRGEAELRVTGSDGLRSAEVALLAYDSIAAGGPVLRDPVA